MKSDVSVKLKGQKLGRTLKQQVKEFVGGNYYMLLMVNKLATDKVVAKIRADWLGGDLAKLYGVSNEKTYLAQKIKRGLSATPMVASGTLANSLIPSAELPSVTIRVGGRADYHIDRANLGWTMAGFNKAHPDGDKKIRGNKRDVFTRMEVTTFLSKWVGNSNMLLDGANSINSLFAAYYPSAFQQALAEYRGQRIKMTFPQAGGAVIDREFKFPQGIGMVSGFEGALKDYLDVTLDKSEMMEAYMQAEARMRQKYSGVEQG